MDKKLKERMNMKLAEKIFHERKKLGMSQEQFAEQMEVSRQAVSKWESGQSMPDLDKIILMSNVFGVSTDYLLKEDSACFAGDAQIALENDGISEGCPVREDIADQSVTRLGKEEVFQFLQVRNRGGIQITIGVVFCVLGVVLSIGMEMKGILTGYPEELMDLLSGIAVFVGAAVGIVLFMVAGMALSKYDFLEKQDFVLPEELKGQLKKDYDKYHKRFTMKVILGVTLCIAAVIMMLIFSYFAEMTENILYEDYIGPMVLLIMVAAAVAIFISDGMKHGSYEIILQMNEYSIEQKRKRRERKDNMSLVAAIYWCVVSAIYIGYSFVTEDWERSWIVWPVAGCFFGAVAAVCSRWQPFK